MALYLFIHTQEYSTYMKAASTMVWGNQPNAWHHQDASYLQPTPSPSRLSVHVVCTHVMQWLAIYVQSHLCIIGKHWGRQVTRANHVIVTANKFTQLAVNISDFICSNCNSPWPGTLTAFSSFPTDDLSYLADFELICFRNHKGFYPPSHTVWETILAVKPIWVAGRDHIPVQSSHCWPLPNGCQCTDFAHMQNMTDT